MNTRNFNHGSEQSMKGHIRKLGLGISRLLQFNIEFFGEQ